MGIPLRVLVVEDAEDDAELLLRALRRGGYDVTWERVETPAHFLAALDTQPWDLIVADYSMPHFSGLAALKLLQTHQSDLPCIVVSGAMGEDVAVEVMKAGASDYLMKGNFARLIPAVERELREAGSRRERRRAEHALRASEERYRNLFEHANDMIYTHDLRGIFTSINHKAESLMGYAREDVIGTSVVQFVVPEHAARVQASLTRLLQQAQENTICEVEIVCKDGNRLPLEISLRCMYDAGKPVGFQGIARDISERRHLEAQLRQAQKMEAIGRLAGGVAHDFNNLLTAILGYSQLIMYRLPPEDPTYEEVAEIEKAGQRAAALTRQLLAFSRKQVLQPQLVNLNQIVTEIEKMLHRMIGEDIELVTALDPSLHSIKADPGQLEQVLMNLAVNARDAMPNGGHLHISTTNIEVQDAQPPYHREIQPGSYVELKVQDTGIGMDQETQEHIFEPFFTTKELGKGTGLGLSTVYGIITQSNGHIVVTSILGVGTTFSIYLPLADAVAEHSPSTPASARPLTGAETVLLVEDNEAVRSLVQQVLQRYGYATLAAQNPHDALAICEAHPGSVDLLITDVIMPQLNGPELAQRLMALRPEMQVLYMSGHTARALGAYNITPETPFLQKPFTPKVFVSKVREVLDTRSQV